MHCCTYKKTEIDKRMNDSIMISSIAEPMYTTVALLCFVAHINRTRQTNGRNEEVIKPCIAGSMYRTVALLYIIAQFIYTQTETNKSINT